MSPGLQWIQASTCSIRPLGHCPSNVFRCFRLPIYRRGVAWRLPARQEGLQPSVVWPEIPLSRLDDDGAGGDGDESEFERRTALGIYQTQEEIDEDEPERQRWHRQLAILARSGKYNKAAEVLDEMLRNGLTPGPRACHALLVAHASAGDAQGACLALELMQLAGGSGRRQWCGAGRAWAEAGGIEWNGRTCVLTPSPRHASSRCRPNAPAREPLPCHSALRRGGGAGPRRRGL